MNYKPLWESDEHAHHRHVTIDRVADMSCMVCRHMKPTLYIDTSAEEYLPLIICKECFVEFIDTEVSDD